MARFLTLEYISLDISDARLRSVAIPSKGIPSKGIWSAVLAKGPPAVRRNPFKRDLKRLRFKGRGSPAIADSGQSPEVGLLSLLAAPRLLA